MSIARSTLEAKLAEVREGILHTISGIADKESSIQKAKERLEEAKRDEAELVEALASLCPPSNPTQ